MRWLPRVRLPGAIGPLVAMAVLASCGAPLAPTAPPSPSGVATSSPFGNVDLDALRHALLGDPPYPSGAEERVDQLMAEIEAALDGMSLPDVSGMDAEEAACATWSPLVGNTDYANGAFLERHFFVAHVAALTEVAPDEIRPAAEEATAVSSAAVAEQLKEDGDPAIISRAPDEEMRTIGLWAVEHCDLPVEAEDAPNTEGWTDEHIAQSCTWDRQWLEDGQEEYFAGPGDGRYAEHPHVLEVTVEIFPYPAWHRLAGVDNESEPPTFRVEPIPGAFCDM